MPPTLEFLRPHFQATQVPCSNFAKKLFKIPTTDTLGSGIGIPNESGVGDEEDVGVVISDRVMKIKVICTKNAIAFRHQSLP